MSSPIERITGGEEAGGLEGLGSLSRSNLSGNIFEDVLSNAIDALNKVSDTELYANQLVDKYIAGEVGMQEVMVATSKMSLMVQLAVTTITTAVNTFKEIAQMQV